MENKVIIYSPTKGYLDGQGDNCLPNSEDYWDWTPDKKRCWHLHPHHAQQKLEMIKKVVSDAYIRQP